MTPSAESRAEKNRIGIVILAAGESARMGQPKQLLPFRGTTLLRHTADTALALGAGPVAVVLGAFADAIRPTLENLPALIVENPDWREGMGTSLCTGLRALLDAHPDLVAAIFLLSDQPLLSAENLHSLITAHEHTSSAIIASEYDGTLGVPALFHRSLFPELLALADTEGAKKIIARHRGSVATVPFPEGAVDMDTPSDYARLREK